MSEPAGLTDPAERGPRVAPAFVDSHAHLADTAFDPDIDQVIDRAVKSGARAIICIGESVAAAERSRAMAGGRPGFLGFTAGVHPHDASGFDPVEHPRRIAEFIGEGAVAIGECGLDYHYDNSPRKQQRRAFAAQLALALDASLPVVVHSRSAEDDTLAMVAEAGAAGVKGVLHCFTGTRALAEAALAVGWYISFSGMITFRNWADDEILRMVPEGRLLVESDAPYLAPVPHRGKRNEPAWVSLTVAHLADVRGDTAERMGNTVVRNAARLFGLPLTAGSKEMAPQDPSVP